MSKFPSDPRPIVISGPSGVGKGTLYTLLLSRHPSIFTTSISHTTRSPRPGEVPGKDYYYISMQDFEDMIEKEEFVEHAKFGGNRYGTSRGMIEGLMKGDGEGGKRVVVLDIEMEGVKQIHSHPSFSCRYVFISPPTSSNPSDPTAAALSVLESRLRGRGTETDASIEKRLAQAKVELEYSKEPGVHDVVIVNDELESAYKELETFVFGGEKTQEQGAKDEGKAGESVKD